MARAFVFPGQGSQAVGMGAELLAAFPVARQVVEEVDDALGQRLSRIIAEGPEADLTLTENAQPALMAISLAVLRVLETEGGLDLAKSVRLVAGHSLGEYSALTAARTLALGDAARLLKRRGQAMQTAVPVGAGAMVALLGADLDQARAIAAEAAETEVCDPANDNAPGQVVLSGSAAAVDRAIRIAGEKGIKRSIRLPVSAPFHCALMAPAAEAMEEALASVTLKRPLVPVVANVTARPVDDPARIRELLVQQVTRMVRWRESVIAMKEADVDTLVEIGAGKVLATLARRIDKDVNGISVGTPAEVEAFLRSV
ncbi:MAG: ACP S-malonyltransferase [Alphaproteobacteria bacterium]|nr:ACP S-malonyltransferase [Alphaproteobacteria bacterium]